MKLLNEINERMKEVGVYPKDRIDIYNFLRILKLKDSETYSHSIRVALIASKAAEVLNIDPKAMLFSGCLHDIGKIEIDINILNKPDFNEQDMELVKNHVLYSYNIIHERFGFTADVIVRHHYWQEGGYPKELPEFNKKYSQKTKDEIIYYSRILALVDFYDAATTRNNNRFPGKKNSEKIKNALLEKNQDMSGIIELLYDKGILV